MEADSQLWRSLFQSPMWRDAGVVVIMCSGGRDSTALLCAAAKIAEYKRDKNGKETPCVIAWHLDHCIRSDSAEDAKFVEELAAKLGCECVIERVDVQALIDREGGNLEEAASRTRYSRVVELTERLDAELAEGLSVVAATGHHKQDQAETILFNMTRGTQLAGLRGIAPVRDGCIHRPWLDLEPQLITVYLKSIGQGWRNDPMNDDMSYSRVRIRKRVIPQLLEINPAAVKNIAGLAELARSLDKLEKQAMLEFGKRVVDAGSLQRLPLISKPPSLLDIYVLREMGNSALLAAFVSHLLERQGCQLTPALWSKLSEWARNPETPLRIRQYELSFVRGALLQIASADFPENFQSEGGQSAEAALAGQPEMQKYITEVGQSPCLVSGWADHVKHNLMRGVDLRARLRAFLPAGEAKELMWRTWREGDFITLTNGGRKKLQDVFTDAQIPKPLRCCWAVLAKRTGDDGQNGEVIWLPGLADSATMARAGEADELACIALPKMPGVHG